MLLPPLPTPPADALVLLHEWEQQHHAAETGGDSADGSDFPLGRGDDSLWEDDDAFTDPDVTRSPPSERRDRHVPARVPKLLVLSRHPALVEVSVRSKRSPQQWRKS